MESLEDNFIILSKEKYATIWLSTKYLEDILMTGARFVVVVFFFYPHHPTLNDTEIALIFVEEISLCDSLASTSSLHPSEP